MRLLVVGLAGAYMRQHRLQPGDCIAIKRTYNDLLHIVINPDAPASEVGLPHTLLVNTLTSSWHRHNDTLATLMASSSGRDSQYLYYACCSTQHIHLIRNVTFSSCCCMLWRQAYMPHIHVERSEIPPCKFGNNAYCSSMCTC